MGRRLKNINAGHPRVLIANDSHNSPISEQYRSIRTNLEFSFLKNNFKCLVITSPGPSEGKSLTAANLATVFAQQNKKVLLIDADMRKPTVHYTFRSDNSNGLSTYLAEYEHSLAEIIKSTFVENLEIISSGPIPPNPSELLSSKRMQKVVQQVRQHYDLILIDSPPVLPVSDSQILTNYSDGILMVVRCKKTESQNAIKAKDLMMNSSSRLVGVVLNDVKKKNKEYYYGQG